ncbi:hypothetical protein P256_00887 [Acinetobacter nectaris CIP 110549]|uniref:Lipid/polyisoprenoid-binding YceI-like domain-containing protein n=1 Tax=Acinetobacter nectaris CIP 110549 TaxID=1392540 RepID=V2TXF4_9GAMM|nr:YceI family protein [Acinetobacter nectaris]ESK40435.1 hypothetical protein P256_00887 [Acinetobacter nectaris CIP 110549]MCF9045863.1 YceI family protein [Acinetobacter nectaris]
MLNIKKAIIQSFLVFSLFCSLINIANATDLKFADDGEVGFYIKKLGMKVIDADFQQVDSTIRFDPNHLEQTQIHFVIQVESIDLSNGTLHDILLGEDLFDVAKYKEITFDSTQIQSLGSSKYNVFGNLTIKGKTKQVVFYTTISPENDGSFDFKAATQIQTKNFAMQSKFGSLTDHVDIFVDGALVKK